MFKRHENCLMKMSWFHNFYIQRILFVSYRIELACSSKSSDYILWYFRELHHDSCILFYLGWLHQILQPLPFWSLLELFLERYRACSWWLSVWLRSYFTHWMRRYSATSYTSQTWEGQWWFMRLVLILA